MVEGADAQRPATGDEGTEAVEVTFGAHRVEGAERVAGIAGVALSQIDNVSPNLGQGYIIDSFMVVVFGGVGNLWGTLEIGRAHV